MRRVTQICLFPAVLLGVVINTFCEAVFVGMDWAHNRFFNY